MLSTCDVVQYFVSFLVLQSSRWGRESWLLNSLYFSCFFGVILSLCGWSLLGHTHLLLHMSGHRSVPVTRRDAY